MMMNDMVAGVDGHDVYIGVVADRDVIIRVDDDVDRVRSCSNCG